MSLVMKNLAKRSTVLITFTVKNPVRSQEDYKKREELLKTSVGTKPNGYELAMNKFSLEIRSRFLNRGVRFLNDFLMGNNRSKSCLILRQRLINLQREACNLISSNCRNAVLHDSRGLFSALHISSSAESRHK